MITFILVALIMEAITQSVSMPDSVWLYPITVVLVCAIQLLFCFKIRRVAVKLLPLYVLLVEAAACGIYLLAVTGWDALIGWVGLVGVGIAAVGVALAWVIFAICHHARSEMQV